MASEWRSWSQSWSLLPNSPPDLIIAELGNDVVYFFRQLEYGEETWLSILEHVGLRNTVFRTHHIYPDDMMAKLAEAAVKLVANGSTTQDFLRFFGRCFVRYFSHYGYEKFIKVS